MRYEGFVCLILLNVDYLCGVKCINSFAEKLSVFLSKGNIIVEKTGKKGKITQVDLAGKIISKDVSFDNGVCILNVTLPSGTTENINPALLIGAFGDTVIEMPCLDILRLKLYCGEEEYI